MPLITAWLYLPQLEELDDDEWEREYYSKTPPSRRGRNMIAGHYPYIMCKQFKLLALENDLSVQALLGIAINDLFEKHGKSRITY